MIFMLLVALISSVGHTCNQRMYDMVYKAIVQEALKKDCDDPETFKVRNDRIEALRDLCEGQKSTYEINIVFDKKLLDKK